jgi:D-glycero-beta-D-manno-heptose-7-phosphate kinase
MADATDGMKSRATEGRESAASLLSLIAAFRRKRIVVFGDLIADEFVYGRIARVSREAPVLILEYDATEIVPGGAGNAANNVASLGGRVGLVSLAGRDEAGDRLFKVLPRPVERTGLSRPAGYRTPVKTRILAGGIHSAKQQVVRIDRYTSEPLRDAHRRAAERGAMRAIKDADAVLISDYGSGLVQPKFVTELAAKLRARRPDVPVLIDSRYALTRYRGLTACTPNESEVEQVLGVTIDDNKRVLEKAGRALLEQTQMACVLVTRGSRGMALFERHKPTIHIPIFVSEQFADFTGAGDTLMATISLAPVTSAI